jgi:hypothetical protein
VKASGYVACYLAQLALAGYAFVKLQPRTSFDEKLRRMAIGAGILPCFLLSLFYQVIAIGIYHARSAKFDRDHASAQRALRTTFDQPSSQERPSLQGRNPFEFEGGGSKPQTPTDNPFG